MKLAFSSIHVDVQGQHQYFKGSLFSLPPELCDNFRISRYLEIKGLGWSKSEFGYMAYIEEDSAGNKIIIPGLYLTDAIALPKSFMGTSLNFLRQMLKIM